MTEMDKIISSLSEVNKLIALTLNTRKTFSLIASLVAKITEAKVVTLRILSKDKKQLILEASAGISRKHSKQRIVNSDQGIVGLVLKHQKPILIKDILKDKRYGNFAFVEEEKIRALLAVPLSIKGKKVGVLSIYHSTIDFPLPYQ